MSDRTSIKGPARLSLDLWRSVGGGGNHEGVLAVATGVTREEVSECLGKRFRNVSGRIVLGSMTMNAVRMSTLRVLTVRKQGALGHGLSTEYCQCARFKAGIQGF